MISFVVLDGGSGRYLVVGIRFSSVISIVCVSSMLRFTLLSPRFFCRIFLASFRMSNPDRIFVSYNCLHFNTLNAFFQ